MIAKTDATEQGVLIHEEKKNYSNSCEENFEDYINKMRKRLSIRLYGAKHPKNSIDDEQPRKTVKLNELAHMVGIAESTFPRIINMKRPTNKRDCIIAICIELQLNSFETNEALRLYNNMPGLDADNPREDFLIDLLEEHSTDAEPISIKVVDERLSEREFGKLNIVDQHINKGMVHTTISKFKVEKTRVRTFADDLIYGDQYDSLETEYSPDNYRCVAEMILTANEGKVGYWLMTDYLGSCSLQKLGGDFTHSQHFNSPEEAGEFRPYFIQLKNMVRIELKRMLTVLDDTRNYKKRISAGIEDNALKIYSETFNYAVPELNEYYFMKKSGGQYVMSVFPISVFMRQYLSADVYKGWYGNCAAPNPLATYHSIEEIENDKSTNRLLLSYRKNRFNELQEDIDMLWEALRDRKRFIRKLENIFEDEDRVCEFFNVAREFDCTLDEETGNFISAGVKEHEFTLPDGDSVIITLQDLYDAFELGFTNIEEICRAKLKLGSIRAILD